MPTPCIPQLYRDRQTGELIPSWKQPDLSACDEILMEDPPHVPDGWVAELAEQPDEENLLRYRLVRIDVEILRAARLAELAAVRYAREVGGTTYQGWPLATDRDSQGKAVGAFTMASGGLWPQGSAWKFADGIARALTAEQVQQMAPAIAAHVQACFDREAELAAEIRASADPLAIDLQSGWPA